ncbi:MAG: hypothetical protein GXO78_07260 [Calditrichaeota bacterium]|nr:hypothetical protein [Calditrichota bacterium]
MNTLQLHSYYLAIIGDIVRSREIENRKAFQRQFHRVMAELNQQFQSEIVSPFTVTLGDEFQALLHRADALFEIYRFLHQQLHPRQLVIGVGVGEIETEINRESSIGMDGPCLRLAREEIEAAKRQPPRLRFNVQGLEVPVLNVLMQHIERLEAKRTPRQREIVAVYRNVRHQETVARQLGISQAAVSQALENAHYFLVEESQAAIVQFLNQFIKPIV